LRAAGIEVFFDQSELRGGDVWDQKIRREIHDCALFIPIVSSNTASRHEGYFRLEWDLADQRSHMMARSRVFVVPVCLDATTEAAADVPESFKRVQWTRLPGGQTSPEFVARIKRLLTTESATSAGPMAGTASPVAAPAPDEARASAAVGARTAPPHSRRLVGVAIAAAIGLVLALGYVGLERFVLSKRATVAPVASSEKSIAVLPFVDLSEKHDQEYFADGMAEEVLDLLAKYPQLKVIGRTSSFQFKGRNEDLRVIGEKLGVAHVLEGSVRKAGPRIRVTAQLVDAASGAHVWSESYDREYGDVLSLQDQIATSIARVLQGAAGGDESQTPRRLQNTEAYTLYVRGLAAIAGGDEASLAQAVSDADRARSLDPTFLQAAELLAIARMTQVLLGFVPPTQGWPLAKEATERAMAIDPRSGRAHATLAAYLAQHEYDWSRAEEELTKATQFNPGGLSTLTQTARIAFARGRYDEARQALDRAMSADPLDPISCQIDAWFRYMRGDLASAEIAIRRSIELSPTFAQNHFILGAVLLARGQREAALKAMEEESIAGGRDPGLTLVYYALGHKDQSDAALARMLQSYAADDPESVAEIYAYRQESDKAFLWLDKAYAVRDPELLWIRDNPLLRSLHGDPRWKALLRKMNLPE
jgi:TolB-like protein/Tfp pilus assembly protein PilF